MDADRAALSVARKLARSSHHIVRRLGEMGICDLGALLAGQGLLGSLASDRTKIDDSSQPSSVARLSHQSIS